MTRRYRYRIVDVFTERQFEGNPLAVFPEATGLDDATMQRIAREMNLSETVFLFPAREARFAARLKIFTTVREMAFAGHPTIGASYVMARSGRFEVEENVGPVPIRVDDTGTIWLTTPPIRDGQRFERAACAAMLGLAVDDLLDIEPQILDAGNPTLLIPVRDKAAVDRAIPPHHIGHDACLFVFTPTPEGAYSRMFAAEIGVMEDPATGSSTGPLALFMMRHGLAPSEDGARFVSEQGTKMGRRSFLHVTIHGPKGRDGIEVGGHAVDVSEATLLLELPVASCQLPGQQTTGNGQRATGNS
jgi:trans-2,3-dihydro-3-hydroxyanthranilate isomerase